MIDPVKNHPDYYEAKRKALKFKGFVDNATLYFKGGKLTMIELTIRSTSDADFMHDALVKCYGNTVGLKVGNEEVGTHTIISIWLGKIVSLEEAKHIIGSPSSTIRIKKLSDEKISGELPAGFIL